MLFVLLLPVAAVAHDFEKEGIHVADAWVRAPVGLGKTAAGYLSIISMDMEGDRLIGARSEAAERVELHTHRETDGVMRMRPLDGLDVRPMGGTELSPAAHHLMFMGLKRKLSPGDRIPVTLIFATVGEMKIRLTVRK